MSFDADDKLLIKQLVKDKMPIEVIASKWGVTTRMMRVFCEDNGIIRKKKLAPSDTVVAILKMQKSHSADAIAVKLNRSVDYVKRIIHVHVKQIKARHHEERVNAVRQLANAKDIPISAAIVMLGITKGSYEFSRNQLNKKAPA